MLTDWRGWKDACDRAREVVSLSQDTASEIRSHTRAITDGGGDVVSQSDSVLPLLHWGMGINYQTVALQSVVAELAGGDAIHHACGIPVFNGRGCHVTLAKRVLQWSWLIIDEIRMASAKLLTELEVKLRNVVRQIGTAKRGKYGIQS